MLSEYDNLFTIIVIGDSYTGKSSLIYRMCNNKFEMKKTQTTIGIDILFKYLKIDENIIKIRVYDTAGNENFKSIQETCYKSIDGVVVIYDNTNIQSQLNVKKWITNIKKHIQDIPIVILGNKIDSQNDNWIQDKNMSISKYIPKDIEHFFVSAKSGYNIDNFVTKLTLMILDNKSIKRKIKFVNIYESKSCKNIILTNEVQSSIVNNCYY